LVSRRAGFREGIADGMIIAIAEVLLTLANDLFFDPGGKTLGKSVWRRRRVIAINSHAVS
jgi:hypothetical protein